MDKSALRYAIDDGIHVVTNSLDGDLDLRSRKAVWRALGSYELDSDNRATRGAGHQRRAELAALAVERVLPLWETHVPDQQPHELIRLARQYMSGDAGFATLWNASNDLVTRGQNTQGLSSEQFPLVYVAQAAAALGFTALKDEWCDDSPESDEDIDNWDAAYLASWAYSGGAKWEPSGSGPSAVVRRREYWLWYLSSAVPAAAAVVPANEPGR